MNYSSLCTACCSQSSSENKLHMLKNSLIDSANKTQNHSCDIDYINNIIKSLLFYRLMQYQLWKYSYNIINHYIKMPINAFNEIDSIIKPLKPFGITTFTYRKTYIDGNKIYLTNDKNWINDYYHDEKYSKILMELNRCIDKITNTSNIYKYIDEQKRLILLKKYDDYVEFFIFSSIKPDFQLNSFYLNNLDLFEAFTVYFEDRADKFITSPDNKILKAKVKQLNKITAENEIYAKHRDLIKNALKEMKVNQYKFKNNNVKISSREIECITSYQAGLTAKESAKLLNISYRTIEKYFDNIKEKLNCSSKKEIVKLLVKDGFPQNILCSSSP